MPQGACTEKKLLHMEKWKDVKKVVLAYSGGLDTSIILKWLQTELGAEVVTFTADLGQGEELEPARRKAEMMGIKDIYIEEGRKMKVITSDGETDMVELMQPTVDESGRVVMLNDLSQGNFDVDVDVGPSSSSKRAATVQALTGMLASRKTQKPSKCCSPWP